MSSDDYIDFDPEEMTGPACTILRPQHGQGRCIKHTEPPKYGGVQVIVARHRGNHCFRFVWQPPDGDLPKPFMRDACFRGVKDGLSRPLSDGRRVAFVQVSVVGGSYHDTDTDEIAMSVASAMAVQDALSHSELVDV